LTCFDNSSVTAIALSDRHNRKRPEFSELITIIDKPHNKEMGAAWALFSVLSWAHEHEFDAVITSPVDIPFLPHDYAEKLIVRYESIIEKPILCISDGNNHALNALWPTSCLEALTTLIQDSEVYKIQTLHKLLGSVFINFENEPYDPFQNINTLDDISLARQRADTFKI